MRVLIIQPSLRDAVCPAPLLLACGYNRFFQGRLIDAPDAHLQRIDPANIRMDSHARH